MRLPKPPGAGPGPGGGFVLIRSIPSLELRVRFQSAARHRGRQPYRWGNVPRLSLTFVPCLPGECLAEGHRLSIPVTRTMDICFAATSICKSSADTRWVGSDSMTRHRMHLQIVKTTKPAGRTIEIGRAHV